MLSLLECLFKIPIENVLLLYSFFISFWRAVKITVCLATCTTVFKHSEIFKCHTCDVMRTLISWVIRETRYILSILIKSRVPFPWISKKSRLDRAARETLKCHNSSVVIVGAVTVWNIADRGETRQSLTHKTHYGIQHKEIILMNKSASVSA